MTYQKTQAQMLRQQAQQRPDALAIRQKKFGIWQPVSWAAYYRRACDVGLGFRALGLGQGAHIAILSENRLEWVLTQLGAGVVGAITVGVYSTSPSNEIAYVLNDSDAEVIICEDQEQADKVLAAIDQLPLLKKIIVLEKKGYDETHALDPQRVMRFSELEAMGAQYGQQHPAQVDACLDAQQPDDTALLIYTSGSTGKPKGAMISYANIAAMAAGVADRLDLDGTSTHLSYLPLCHVAEQMLTAFVPLYLGSRVDFGESIRTVQEDLREVGPSMFLGVPRIWEKLHSSISIKMHESGPVRRWLFGTAMRTCAPFAEKAAHQRSPLQQLSFALCYLLIFRALQNFIGLRRVKIALTGAAPISPAIVQFFRTLGVPLVEVYGMTESSGMVLGQRLDDVRIGRVGLPTLGVEHRLSEQGELQIRGGVVFQGYYKNPEATAATIIDGWLHTGDVVSAGEGGLKIVDRLKDIMITAGGKNLTPSEIENTMKSSHFIKECIVIADARKYVAALIQIDYDAVAQWAEARNIAFTHYRSLIDTPAVRELVQAEIDVGNARLAQVSHIRKFHLLAKELDHDDGEVTATMKVRRSSITKTYAGDIEAMYR
ncbi:AMP-binding protein [Actimicrobium sp. CCC2.4]|uniref:AMP-dependent synthetase/ligase n=1 Tax=Actimicrobium sp. CCC2.4 TaxID=3048606 RepID=UPI002AC8FB19|nr:AMP-binding protein [Actimicrobium sp. CCC2.4]MEB0133957.1 AMP-binding protein [Actimicrobium sp. CCC2.4]WPX31496.1 AMP-binding protein [Actimicrobium sp. CCC2.4]